MNHIRNLAIKAAEFSSRRAILAENILSRFKDKNHMIIMSASDVQYKTRHIPRTYHQDPFFYYYTGFMQKKALLIMNIINGQISSSLFIDKPSKQETLWEGPYPCKEDALAVSGVDIVAYIDEWRHIIDKAVKDKTISYLWSTDCSNSPAFLSNISSTIGTIPLKDLSAIADRQRVIKSADELTLMRASAQMTTRALQKAMSYTRPGINEHELLGKLGHELSVCGGKLAYPPVIGGGARANIIHYLGGDRCIADGELVLVDVGADVLGYYSDVTRTWPINGRFSPAQALLYDVLHTVHTDCVRACTGDKTLNDMLAFMMRRIALYLTQEGVLKDSKNVHLVCPHHIGHYLGLDIHDTPSISTDTRLLPGMVFPLEPGLYFPDNCDFVDPQFRGIGMRLEDDYVMTEAGTVDCLTTDLGRSRAQIEAMCNETETVSVPLSR